MTNITPTTPSFIFGYWRPWKEDSNYIDSYMNYVKDVSLAKYQADTVGQYINQASTEQVQAIGELGDKIGLASREQVQAIGELGDKISELGDTFERGINVLSQHLENINEELSFINKNLDIQIEQQKVTNLLLGNISELLRVPDSEKERQNSIELGLKFFVNAQKDEDLFQDALDELLKAEEIMKQDYFVLHRIGLIYLHSINHINPQKALDYFTRAAKYASVESDPQAARLANVLAKYGNRVNSEVLNSTNAVESLAADSFVKAAFVCYIIGDFESAVKFQSKAVKYKSNSENYFMLAKYQTRTKQIDLCVQNICKSIDETPEMTQAVFKDIDLVNEPEVLQIIEEKNEVINNKILQLIKEWETIPSDPAKILTIKLKESSKATYDKKIKINKVAIASNVRNWTVTNLNVNYFRNGETIPKAKTIEEWVKAGIEGKPSWCYYNNDPELGKIYGKLYNWYAVNDSKGLAPEGWHIPSDDEWNIIIEFLGGKDAAGMKMKSTLGWGENGNDNNESGFAALSGGIRASDGTFYNIGSNAIDTVLPYYAWGSWWSSTNKDLSQAWSLTMSSMDGLPTMVGSADKGFGLSVRCLRD